MKRSKTRLASMLMCVNICVVLASAHLCLSAALFNASDNLNLLTSGNFTDFVVNRHQAGAKLQLVHFYANWCPHCRSFAPKFKNFLHNITSWRNFIDFSAISCSISNPSEWDSVCDKYNVRSVPHFRLFWFAPNSTDGGIPVRFSSDPTKHAASLINSISNNWSRGNIPANWPRFNPLTPVDLIELIVNAPTPLSLVVVEQPSSQLARELMLRFGDHFEMLRFYSLLYDVNSTSDRQIWQGTIPTDAKLPFIVSIEENEPIDFLHGSTDTSGDNSEDADLDFFSKLIKRHLGT